jgi:hypothetical protein
VALPFCLWRNAPSSKPYDLLCCLGGCGFKILGEYSRIIRGYEVHILLRLRIAEYADQPLTITTWSKFLSVVRGER